MGNLLNDNMFGMFYIGTDGHSVFPNVFKDLLVNYKKINLPERYILNENACICFWKDGTKTVSIKHKEDIFDKEFGFLMCCFQHYNAKLSRNKRKKILSWIKQEYIKEYLFDMFVEKNEMTINEAKAYLRNLKVEKSKNNSTSNKKVEHIKEDN